MKNARSGPVMMIGAQGLSGVRDSPQGFEHLAGTHCGT